MGRSSLEGLALDWMRFWQGRDLAGFDRVHAPSFVDRSAADKPPDRVGFREGVAALYRAFPDFAATVQFMATDEFWRLVTIRWSAVGHMHGPFLGAEPAGRLRGAVDTYTTKGPDGCFVIRNRAGGGADQSGLPQHPSTPPSRPRT